jgi:phenylpropionate dioxygenase-like ring-hydroxylating dioxygenase large terminal subunit
VLSKEENALLTQVGPGTPMGNLMRQYWLPGLLASELEEKDGAPIRVRLLGEDLIAFRDTHGKVGLLRAACPHRGASLFFGRNEEHGLRCVYHGWKYDVSGQCVDMPSEPPESTFKRKIKATAYPCAERGGIIWTYMGPRAVPPPLPDLEPNMLPDGEWTVSAVQRECNYFQALEGDIDTSHAQFLHHGGVRTQATRPGTFMYYRLQEKAPHYAVVDTEFGTMYGAYRPAEADTDYWRIACFLLPCYTIIPTGALGDQVSLNAWVPMDDEHTLYIRMSRREQGTHLRVREPRANAAMTYEPRGTDPYGRFRLALSQRNDYRIDRALQRTRSSYTGIDGIYVQDQMVTESMGPVVERSDEHLGSSDAMIIRSRQRIINAAKALAEASTPPPGAEDPAVFRVRGGGVILPRGVNWLEATERLREAFASHPEIDPAIVG